MPEELIHLTQDTEGMGKQSAYPDLSPSPGFIELYRYQVPVGHQLIFSNGHTFSLFAKYLNENVDACGYYDASVPGLVEFMRAIEFDGGNANLGPSVSADGDYCYFGYRYKWKEMYISPIQANLVDSRLASQWDYWNGSSWADLPNLVDGTDGFGGGDVAATVSWTLPGDWAIWKDPGPSIYAIRRVIAGKVSGSTLRANNIEVHEDTEVDDADWVTAEVRSEGELTRQRLVGSTPYSNVKEFIDRPNMKKLDAIEPVIANPGDWVIVLVRAPSPVDIAQCNFDLECDRIT